MTVFFDLVRVYCTTLGSAGPLALGGAVTFSGGAKAFRSFADAGIPDGAALSWAIEDLSLPGREAGTGTYSAGAGTVTRNTTSSTNANSPLDLSGQAQLFVTALAADLANAGNFSSGTVPVTCGGTGAGSFTAHGVLLGEGASAFGVAATGTAGQLLIDQGSGSDPAFAAMSGDATIASTGAITITKTGGAAFTPAATAAAGQLPATATNDSASAGKLGEYVASAVQSGSAVSLTSGTPANVTSIALTAGDWDVFGSVAFTGGGTTTVTGLQASISSASAALSYNTPNYAAATQFGNSGGLSWLPTLVPGPLRVSLASGVTIYLVAQAAFGVSTCQAYGTLQARRAR